MESHRLRTGRVIDGFTLEELVHTGGMAALWRVTKPDEPRSMLMKVPFLGEGDDHSAIIGIEIEHMILPRLAGPRCPCRQGSRAGSLPHLGALRRTDPGSPRHRRQEEALAVP
jgi:hypothetical protein